MPAADNTVIETWLSMLVRALLFSQGYYSQLCEDTWTILKQDWKSVASCIFRLPIIWSVCLVIWMLKPKEICHHAV